MSRPDRPAEPSPQALRAVAAFRRRGQLSGDAKDALRDRIGASMTARTEVQAPIDVAGSAWRIGVAMAAAAGVLLALRVVGSSGTFVQRAAPSSDQAVYEATPSDPEPGRVSPRARSQRPVVTETSTPIDDTAPPPSDDPSGASPPADRSAVRAPASARPPEPGPPAPTPEADLAAELTVMRRARAALGQQDPEHALRLLDEHAARFASGQMLEDRQALRVQALCDAGRGDRAREAARRFAQEHPGSPHVARVTKICIEA